jgi:hypothetical protein
MGAHALQAFLATLAHVNPEISCNTPGNWTQLYADFLECQNFRLWLNMRLREANDRLRRAYLDLLARADILRYVGSKSDVEMLDLWQRIRDELVRLLTAHAIIHIRSCLCHDHVCVIITITNHHTHYYTPSHHHSIAHHHTIMASSRVLLCVPDTSVISSIHHRRPPPPIAGAARHSRGQLSDTPACTDRL